MVKQLYEGRRRDGVPAGQWHAKSISNVLPIWAAVLEVLISAPEAKVSVLDRRVLGRVGDDVNLSVVRILKHQITTLISELHAGAVEREQKRLSRPDGRIDRSHARVLVYQPPVRERLSARGEVGQNHDLAACVRAARIDQRALDIDCGRGDCRRWRWCPGKELADRRRAGRGVARGIGRNPLRLETQEETEIPIGKLQDQSAVVKHAVVAAVLTNVTLVHVDVMNAVETVCVAELGIDRLVQVLIKLRAERVDLAAGRLALVEI
jgi:hypothetical protein